jgi:thiol-disulfide isomerase/thioredoxin
MAGERLHGSLRWLLALAACTSLSFDQTAALGAEPAAAGREAEGLLLLSNGDRLRGTLVTSEKPAEITWQSPAFVEPFHFPLAAIQVIKFDAPASAMQGEYRVELQGGDELHGTLTSIDKNAIVVTAKWGTFRAKRASVASLSHLHQALRRRGKSLAVEKLVTEKTHVVLATNRVVYAELTGYNARSTEFSFQAKDAALTYRANDISQIVLADAGPTKEPVRLEYADGTRLSGELVKIGERNVVIKSSALLDAATLPLSGLRSVRAATAGTPQPRRHGDALLMVNQDRLRGRLVAVEPKAGQTSFGWQPSGSSNAAAIRTEVAASIDFGQAALAAVTDEETPDGDRIFLRSGDVLKCRISAINPDETVLNMPGSALKQMPNSRIKAVELGPHLRGAISDDKLARLLTVPRLQKGDPPTHVLSSLDNDYLRGRLIGVSEGRVLFETGTARREFPRDRIASIIWLDAPPGDGAQAAGEPPADRTTAGVVQVTDVDGLSLRLVSARLDQESLVGANEVLGDCRLPLNRLSGLRLGQAGAPARLARRYVTWKLTSAVEPKAFAEDADAGGESAETSELVGRPAPEFTLELLDGSRFRLSAQRGKVVVLDFWASWCAPCVKGLPEVAALAADFDPEKVRFVAVNLQETRDDAALAVSRLKLGLPVALDGDGRVAARYGAASIPYTVVVGPDGKFARVVTGYGPRSADELKEAIGRVMASAPPTQ